MIPADLPGTEADVGLGDSDAVARDSLAVAFWVVVCRVTGFGRVVLTAAVLGPTFLGNTFQALNTLPNLAFEFLAGTLFGALLIPALVRHVDRDCLRSTERFACGFLGLATAAFAGLTCTAILASPMILRVFTVAVADPAVVRAQQRVGSLLLALLLPQMLLYPLAGVGAAVMNARGRFALAAAAPAFENLGIIATLLAAAALFGTKVNVLTVQTSEIFLLGVGTTAAVGLHAGAMWWGARRAGVVLRPRAGWRDPEVVELVRRAIPALGYVWLNVLASFALLVVANRTPGGVVAFQLAMNFCSFSVHVAAQPVAVAVRPRLARLFREGKLESFRDELVKAGTLTAFFIVPAAVGLLVLATPLARVAAIGAMGTSTGVLLVSSALVALALGVVGESAFKLLRDASYAREDAGGPFQAMLARTVFVMGAVVAAYLWLDGRALLFALGMAVSAGNLVAAWSLALRVRMALPAGAERLAPSFCRTAVGALVMAGPAYLIGNGALLAGTGQLSEVAALMSAASIGLAVFLSLQHLSGSPELRDLLRALRPVRRAGGV